MSCSPASWRPSTQLLNAERSTLFLYDAATDELWSQVAEGAGQKEIRIPARAGIAGAAFAGGEVLVVPDAYADRGSTAPSTSRPAIAPATSWRCRSSTRSGERLGVVQVLNKRGGAFTPVDIRRAKAFCAQIAIAIQNAQLFSDVLSLKNYNESILKSLSNGVITLDQDLNIVKINEAAERILGMTAGRRGEPAGRAGLRQPQRLGHAQPRLCRARWAPPTITPTPISRCRTAASPRST